MKFVILLCLLGCMATANGFILDLLKDKKPSGREDSGDNLNILHQPMELFSSLLENFKKGFTNILSLFGVGGGKGGDGEDSSDKSTTESSSSEESTTAKTTSATKTEASSEETTKASTTTESKSSEDSSTEDSTTSSSTKKD
ncbi:uncharacterized protein LOC108024394 isoform X1 [Drosophila biarmipes]|uniref:uncharacterized protein LOC108024394 isoform X1 n=1 Tax=Drosophila biarmipes TaxID=125945 RepID=UPI0007E6AD19|nr:uncharacterized protein LOC108024394 isoform X1 [Drosophila biarmipes]